MAGGRPVKYDEQYVNEICKQLPGLYKDGLSTEEVVATLGISNDTFYRLLKKYPQLSEAKKVGEQLSLLWWSQLGRDGAIGNVDIQPTVWIFNMKNRFGWKDKKETTVKGDEENPLQFKIIFDD